MNGFSLIHKTQRELEKLQSPGEWWKKGVKAEAQQRTQFNLWHWDTSSLSATIQEPPQEKVERTYYAAYTPEFEDYADEREEF